MPLFSAKNFFVKIERGQAVADYQMWNELILQMHENPPSCTLQGAASFRRNAGSVFSALF
jgi:hypothetical protein